MEITDLKIGEVIVGKATGNEWTIVEILNTVVFLEAVEGRGIVYYSKDDIYKNFTLKQPEPEWPCIGDTVITINSMLDAYKQPWTGSTKQKRKLEAGFIQSSMVAADIAIKRIKEAVGR